VKTAPRDGDREVRDLDPDPATAELLGGDERSLAPAESVEHDVAGAKARGDDPLQERHRLLRRGADALLRPRDDGLYALVSPDVLQRYALHLVEVALAAGEPIRREVDAPLKNVLDAIFGAENFRNEVV
jgi:hypothetical protein